MELEKTTNAINGTITGIIQQIVNTLMPFALRTVMVYSLGIDYAGINSLFSSILSMLNLAELGFSSAVIFAMYQPIKENNTKELCQLLGYFRKVYFSVGLFIGIAGVVLTPFLNVIITSPVPDDLNMYLLYYGFLFNTVVTYLFGGYRSSVLLAYQRNDIINKISTIVSGVGYTCQILSLLWFHNYYIYIFLMITMNIISTASAAWIAKKKFPSLNPENGLKEEKRKMIFSKVKDLLFQRIGNTVSTSFDNMIISRYLGLTAVAIYGNYFYIFSAAKSFMNTFYSSLTAGIGNKILNASLEDNRKVFKRLLFISGLLTSFCCTCLCCLYQPFMEAWMGKENMYSMKIVLIFCIYFFIVGSRMIIDTYKSALGLWHPDRWKSIIGAGVNLTFNIILVKAIGVAGVILSTIVSYTVIEIPWETHVLYKHYFHTSSSEYYLSLLKNGCLTVLTCSSVYAINSFIGIDGTWINVFLHALITIIACLSLFWILFRRSEDFSFLIQQLKKHRN